MAGGKRILTVAPGLALGGGAARAEGEVPIRLGNFPWRCRGLEGKGMAGAFAIK
jgi:hypothetical protein